MVCGGSRIVHALAGCLAIPGQPGLLPYAPSMSDAKQHNRSTGADPIRTVLPERADPETTTARCVIYAILSDLAASPFDAEPAVAGEEIDIAALGLPYELENFQALLDEWRKTDHDELKRTYSALFEVGSNGPPVPIREDLHLNQPAGLREDIVRFFDFFGYGLEENFAWAPDHLSVEFEFMHYLIYHEAEQVGQAQGDALSFQLAQYDFAERHLCNWVPGLADRVAEHEPDSLYARLFAGVSNCLQKDFAWQATTVSDTCG